MELKRSSIKRTHLLKSNTSASKGTFFSLINQTFMPFEPKLPTAESPPDTVERMYTLFKIIICLWLVLTNFIEGARMVYYREPHPSVMHGHICLFSLSLVPHQEIQPGWPDKLTCHPRNQISSKIFYCTSAINILSHKKIYPPRDNEPTFLLWISLIHQFGITTLAGIMLYRVTKK